jgi:hypothetical protein
MARAGSPASSVLRSAPTPCPRPAGLRCPSARGDPRAPRVRSARGVGARPGSRVGSCGAAPPAWPLTRRRRQGLPGSCRTPLAHVPRSTTPVGRGRSADCRVPGVAFRTTKNVGPTTAYLSELNHAARALAVYASPAGSPRPDARLASGCSTSLAGRGWIPAGSRCRVSGQVMTSSLPRLGLAHS